MVQKHISFSESIVMRELEKIAHKNGMIEEDIFIPDIKKKASAPALIEGEDLFASIISLAGVMRERGFNKQAAMLEDKAVLYIKAYNTPMATSEDRKENNGKLYNTNVGEGILTSAHEPLDSTAVPSKSGEGYTETIEEINKILTDSTKKAPTGKLGNDLSHKLVIMATEALKKNAQEDKFDPDTGSAELKKSLDDATAAKDQIVEALNSSSDLLKKIVIIDEPTNMFTKEIVDFANTNKIGAKEIAKYSKAKSIEKELSRQLGLINEVKKLQPLPEINTNITDIVNLSPLANSIRAFNQKIQAYKPDDNQTRTEAIQAGATVTNSVAQIIQEYNTNMTALKERIVAGIKQVINSDVSVIDKLKNDIAATNLDLNGGLDLGKATNLVAQTSVASKMFAKWAGPVQGIENNMATLTSGTAALQKAINDDKRFAGGDPVSPDMAQFATTLGKLKSLWDMIRNEKADISDPGAQAIRNYLGKFSKLYSILTKNPNVRFNRLKALYPNIGYSDAKTLMQEIADLSKNTDEADAAWRKQLNVSKTYSTDELKPTASETSFLQKTAAGNPLMPGGGGATTPATTGGGGGGGFAQKMDYMKDPEAAGMVKQMQAALSNFADYFRSKATEGTEDAPVNQDLFAYANAMNTQKGEMGKELDRMWGPNTEKALALVNDLLNKKNKFKKEFPLLATSNVNFLEHNKPDSKESPMSVSRRAKNNIVKIYNILSLAGDPSQAGRLSSLVAGKILDKLPKTPASNTHYAEIDGEPFIPLQAGHLRDLLTLKSVLESEGFNPAPISSEGMVIAREPGTKGASNINDIEKTAKIGLDPEGSASDLPILEKGWSFRHWDNILKYLRNRAVWQYEQATKLPAEDAASKQKRQILTNVKLTYARLVENLLRELGEIYNTYRAWGEKQKPVKGITETSKLPDELLAGRNMHLYGNRGAYGVGGPGGYPGGVSGGTPAALAVYLRYPFYDPNGDNRLIPIKALYAAYGPKLSNTYPNIEKGPEFLIKNNWIDGVFENAANDIRRATDKTLDANSYIFDVADLLRDIYNVYMSDRTISQKDKEVQERESAKITNPINRMTSQRSDNRQKGAASSGKPAPAQTQEPAQQKQAKFDAFVNTGGAKKLLEDQLGFQVNPIQNGGWVKTLKNGDIAQVQLNGIVKLHKKLDPTKDDMSAGPDRWHSEKQNSYYRAIPFGHYYDDNAQRLLSILAKQ